MRSQGEHNIGVSRIFGLWVVYDIALDADWHQLQMVAAARTAA
jgi:hypothetical protein